MTTPPGTAASSTGRTSGAIRMPLMFALLLTFALAACGAPPPRSAGPPETSSAPVAALAPETRAHQPRETEPRGPQPIPVDDTVPERLRITSIGIDTSLETLDRDAAGVLLPPVDPEMAGWYAGGPVPGDKGPAVIAGHIDSREGPAVFARLDELTPGDRVDVILSDGTTVTFVVDGVQAFAQAAFPTTTVYGPVPDSQLRLITCHSFDRGTNTYVENLVVFATATT